MAALMRYRRLRKDIASARDMPRSRTSSVPARRHSSRQRAYSSMIATTGPRPRFLMPTSAVAVPRPFAKHSTTLRRWPATDPCVRLIFYVWRKEVVMRASLFAMMILLLAVGLVAPGLARAQSEDEL